MKNRAKKYKRGAYGGLPPFFKSDLLYMKNSILCKIGNWGPLILFGTSVYLLSDKGNMLYYYIVGLILNTIFNVFLKVTIQQPRPSIDSDRFNLLLKNYNDTLFKHGIPDIFGMPSGHTQSIVFSTMYVFFLSNRETPFWKKGTKFCSLLKKATYYCFIYSYR